MNAVAVSLAVFVAVVAVNVAGLLIDYWLAESGLPTITERAHENRSVAAAVIMWQFVGAVAIAIHFREYRP